MVVLGPTTKLALFTLGKKLDSLHVAVSETAPGVTKCHPTSLNSTICSGPSSSKGQWVRIKMVCLWRILFEKFQMNENDIPDDITYADIDTTALGPGKAKLNSWHHYRFCKCQLPDRCTWLWLTCIILLRWPMKNKLFLRGTSGHLPVPCGVIHPSP